MYVHVSECIMYVCMFWKYVKAHFEANGCACISMSLYVCYIVFWECSRAAKAISSCIWVCVWLYWNSCLQGDANWHHQAQWNHDWLPVTACLCLCRWSNPCINTLRLPCILPMHIPMQGGYALRLFLYSSHSSTLPISLSWNNIHAHTYRQTSFIITLIAEQQRHL